MSLRLLHKEIWQYFMTFVLALNLEKEEIISTYRFCVLMQEHTFSIRMNEVITENVCKACFPIALQSFTFTCDNTIKLFDSIDTDSRILRRLHETNTKSNDRCIEVQI